MSLGRLIFLIVVAYLGLVVIGGPLMSAIGAN